MRKLLTMMAAVASAMGLYAADSGALSGTSFEGLVFETALDTTSGTGELSGTGGFWRTSGTETLTVKSGTSVVEGSANRSTAFSEEENLTYLNVKTESVTNSISRYVNVDGVATNINDGAGATGLYFDSFVRFTAFDSDPQVDLGTSGKLAIWLRESFDADDKPTATNLVITAGYLDSKSQAGAIVTNYNCVVARQINFNDGGWHRVTVKAIDSIYNTVGGTTPGFVVFIDQNYVYCTDNTTMGISGDLKGTASKWNDVHALFPSACQDGVEKDSISAVDFAGQGDVDELVFTRTAPFGDAEDVGLFRIELGEGVAKVTFTTNGVSEEITDNTALTLNDNWTMGGITITATYENGYVKGTWGGLTPYDGDLFKPDADGQYVQVVGKPAGATVDGVGYETLADAIDAANSADSDCTVKLMANADAGITLENNLGATITLDLAGNDITGEDGVEGPAIYVVAGTLIVTNSTPSDIGVVTPGTFEEALNAAVNYDDENATVIIQDGIYNGFVYAASISGGKFLASENAQQELNDMIVDGYEATQVGDYYEVTVKAQTYTVEWIYGLNGENAYTNDNLAANAEMPTPPDASVTGYGYVWTPAVDSVVTSNAIYTAAYTPNEYTITFVIGENSTSEQKEYGSEITSVPEIPVRVGYTGSWDDDPEGDIVTGDKTYTYTYSAETYTITYMYGESTLSGLAPATYTVEDAVTLPTVVDLGVVGVSFEAWTNAQGEVVANWAAGAKTGAQTFYAQTAAVVPTGIDPEAGTVEVTVTAESEEAAIAGVLVTPPTGSGADAAEYKALFNFTAVETSAGSGEYTVTLTGIKEEVVTGVDTSAVTLLTGSASEGTITVPAGLYYRITPSTALPISGTPVSGLSTGASETVTKPGTTKGFYKIELSAVPFAVPNS